MGKCQMSSSQHQEKSGSMLVRSSCVSASLMDFPSQVVVMCGNSRRQLRLMMHDPGAMRRILRTGCCRHGACSFLFGPTFHLHGPVAPARRMLTTLRAYTELKLSPEASDSSFRVCLECGQLELTLHADHHPYATHRHRVKCNVNRSHGVMQVCQPQVSPRANLPVQAAGSHPPAGPCGPSVGFCRPPLVRQGGRLVCCSLAVSVGLSARSPSHTRL